MGVLVDHQLKRLASGRLPAIIFDQGLVPESYIQPASFDLPMRPNFYSIAAEPHLGDGQTIGQYFLDNYRQNKLSVDEIEGFVTLNPGTLYLFEAACEFNLPPKINGNANPKSSTGRNFIHSKLITENGRSFDTISSGYNGKLYILVAPRCFPVRWGPKESLVQIRLRNNEQKFLSKTELLKLNDKTPLLINSLAIIDSLGLQLHLDLTGQPSILVAHKTGRIITLVDRKKHPPHLYFWEKPLDGRGISHLEPGDSALAKTLELIRIPNSVCAEMSAVNVRHGDVRWHDAGFIDPGFGLDPTGNNHGAEIVCEISNIGPSPVQIGTGKEIGCLRFEQLDSQPNKIYGQLNNSYQLQRGIRLAKQFKPWPSSRKIT